jgi:hypothetical protein
MRIEGPRAARGEPLFTLNIRDGLKPEQWADVAHALCKIATCPQPRTPADLRRVTVRTLLSRYQGPISRRAIELEGKYLTYLDGADWRREQHLEKLPKRRGVEHVLLHRFAIANGGRPLGWRQILRVAGPM